MEMYERLNIYYILRIYILGSYLKILKDSLILTQIEYISLYMHVFNLFLIIRMLNENLLAYVRDNNNNYNHYYNYYYYC